MEKTIYKKILYCSIFFGIGLVLLFVKYNAFATRVFSAKMQVVYGLLLLISVLIMSEIDIRTQEIPNWVLSLFLVLGGIQIIWHWRIWSYYLLAFVFMGLFLLLLSLFSGGKLGGGDIKLMALAGLCLGPIKVFLALAMGAFLALIIGVFLIVTRKIKKDTPIAFGPFLGTGIYLAYLYGDQIWQWVMGR